MPTLPARGPGRPSFPPGTRRVSRTVSIAADSEARILQAAAARGVSIGAIIDRLAKKLSPVTPSESGACTVAQK